MTTPDLSPLHESASPPIQLKQLRADIKGRIIAPDDAEYDKARTVLYGDRNRQPALIVKAADSQDVQRVLELARESGLQLAVRGGGHSSAGHGTTHGGIVLDLSGMRALHIDVERSLAWAEAGLTAGEYTAAAGVHGLATGFGDTGSVGIGGLTLGGGVGYLVRKHGLTIDNLISAEIVTAGGDFLHIDERNHPDLFWAIRGGGGNFGVATRFQFRLHRVGKILGGMLILPATPETVAGFIAEAERAPEALSTIANVMKAPPMPFLPAEVHGQLIIMAMMVYTGEPAQGESVISRFRALARPLADMIRVMPYPEIYPQEEAGPNQMGIAGRTMFTNIIDRPMAQEMLERLQTSSAMMAVAQLRVLGGAMGRVPVEATAFAHRGSRIMVNLAAMYIPLEEKAKYDAWVEEFRSTLQQGDPGAYVNFMGDEGPERVRDAYPSATWKRLRAIKRQYDPANLFRLNQNITPA
jgi:FAD/FMN-containing dehydrogenase